MGEDEATQPEEPAAEGEPSTESDTLASDPPTDPEGDLGGGDDEAPAEPEE